MACKNFFLLLFVLSLVASTGATAAWELNGYSKASSHELAAVIEASTNPLRCWIAVYQLINRCREAVGNFFIDGQTAMMPRECCQAVLDIDHYCDPDMLFLLGFTSDQGKILLDHCIQAINAVAPVGSPHSAEAEAEAFV